MKRTVLLLLLVGLSAACEEGFTDPAIETVAGPDLSVVSADDLVGAIVLNTGKASEPDTGNCYFAGRWTDNVTIVRNPNGSAEFICHWDYFPTNSEYREAVVRRNWLCSLDFFGYNQTRKTIFTFSPNHRATVRCTFNEMGRDPQDEA